MLVNGLAAWNSVVLMGNRFENAGIWKSRKWKYNRNEMETGNGTELEIETGNRRGGSQKVKGRRS